MANRSQTFAVATWPLGIREFIFLNGKLLTCDYSTGIAVVSAVENSFLTYQKFGLNHCS